MARSWKRRAIASTALRSISGETLNVAEVEINVMVRECPAARIGRLREAVAAWPADQGRHR